MALVEYWTLQIIYFRDQNAHWMSNNSDISKMSLICFQAEWVLINPTGHNNSNSEKVFMIDKHSPDEYYSWRSH